MDTTNYIKMRVGNLTYEQYDTKRFRVKRGDELLCDTANPVKAAIIFSGTIETFIMRKLRSEIAKQGYNCYTGERETSSMSCIKRDV